MKVLNAKRICPECGSMFTAHHGRQVFCTTAHQGEFHQVMKLRGKIAMPFALVWRTGKRGRSPVRSYALSQLSRLADQWNAEDAACGRRPELIVAAKMREGWTAVDVEGRSRGNCFAPT